MPRRCRQWDESLGILLQLCEDICSNLPWFNVSISMTLVVLIPIPLLTSRSGSTVVPSCLTFALLARTWFRMLGRSNSGRSLNSPTILNLTFQKSRKDIQLHCLSPLYRARIYCVSQFQIYGLNQVTTKTGHSFAFDEIGVWTKKIFRPQLPSIKQFAMKLTIYDRYIQYVRPEYLVRYKLTVGKCES